MTKIRGKPPIQPKTAIPLDLTDDWVAIDSEGFKWGIMTTPYSTWEFRDLILQTTDELRGTRAFLVSTGKHVFGEWPDIVAWEKKCST
jgi:hypothetical protein